MSDWPVDSKIATVEATVILEKLKLKQRNDTLHPVIWPTVEVTTVDKLMAVEATPITITMARKKCPVTHKNHAL